MKSKLFKGSSENLRFSEYNITIPCLQGRANLSTDKQLSNKKNFINFSDSKFFRTAIILLLLPAVMLLLNSCYIITQSNTKDGGLTGKWDASSAPANSLVIENLMSSGSSIDGVVYYVGPTEPSDWSVGTTLVPTPPGIHSDIGIGIPNEAIFTLGNGDNIDTGVAAATVWLKITSGDDFLVSSFDYNPVSANSWFLTVYDKN